MKTEDLKKLGIEDEDVIKQLHALAGRDVEKAKADVASLQAEVENANAQLAEAHAKIESFTSMDIEGVKAAAEEWKAKAEQAQAEAQAQIDKLKFDHALTGALSGAKAKNTKAVMALLNVNDLKLAEDGNILGLSEQLEAIKAENDYLFESDKPAPQFVGKTKNTGALTDTMTAAARRAAGLSD